MKRSLDNSSYEEHDTQKPFPKKFKSLTQYPCELCPRIFFTQSNLSNHINMHKKETLLKKPLKETSFICRYCDKVLACKRNLASHIKALHKEELSPQRLFRITQKIDQFTQRDLNINHNNAPDDKLFIEWLETL